MPKDMGRVDFSQRDRIYFHLDFDSGDNGSICFSSFSGVRYFFSTDSSLTSAEPRLKSPRTAVLAGVIDED